MPTKQPAELLTIANHILGTGQLSLAKFLFITADDTNQLTTHDVRTYLEYVFERMDLTRDIHFHTKTTIDTLDYSGTGLNTGSKVVFAAYGDKKRELSKEVPSAFKDLQQFENPQFAALSTQACSICGRVLQGTSGPDRQSGMLEPEPAGQSSILPPLQNRHTKQNRDCHRRALMEQVGLCKPWQLPAPASGAAPCALYASAESRVRPYFSLVHGINWR